MPSPDFLNYHAETPVHEQYRWGGVVCSLLTNSEAVLRAAGESFPTGPSGGGEIDLRLRLWVDEDDLAMPPWPKPYVRGLDHIAFAAFDSGSSLVADLRARHIIGRFSAGMATDTAYWKAVIFPMLLTIVGASIGIAELHCGCVAKNEDGLLLAGESGSGKSTLAVALSHIGFGFVSDDRTFCSLDNGTVQGWSLATQFKLRPEAMRWFPQLHGSQISDQRSMNGTDVWFDPETLVSFQRLRCCRPKAVLFLQRQKTREFCLRSLDRSDALEQLNRDLLPEPRESAVRRSLVIDKVVDLPCWLLRYGGDPQDIAGKIVSTML